MNNSEIQDNDISIVMQGPIYKDNILEYANHCAIWRENLPNSEIICVVSTSDIFQNHEKNILSICDKLKNDKKIVASLEKIKKISDKLIFLGNDIPLYSLKSDTGLCNGNLQIEAAQAGLKYAKRKYVLRIRSDAIFFDTRFINFYEKNYLKPRGRTAIFEQRVMITNTFTLNPYAMERLPFHWSDWFHFGLLEDVKKLWDIPNIPVSNSLFYKIKPYLPYSNIFERKFFHRVGVEQHINYNFFKKHIPNLKLDYHNDISSRDKSIEILKDNFVVCNAYDIGFFFEKYKWDANHRRFRRWCIGNDIWDELIECEPENYKKKLSFTRNEVLFDKNRPFPRIYEAKDLFSKNGELINQEICLTDAYSSGVLIFGPHVMIPPGRYEIEFFFSHIQAISGELFLKATLDHSAIQLADRRIKVEGSLLQAQYKLYFENRFLNARNFEIIIETNNIEDIAFQKAVISRIEDCPVYTNTVKETSQKDLNIHELSPCLRNFLIVMSKFIGQKKRNKLLYNTNLFFKDSNNTINKIVKKFYDKENSIKNKKF